MRCLANDSASRTARGLEMLKAYRLSLALAIAAGLATPALAGESAPASSAPAASGPNPNEIICEKQQQTGSRLVARKVCKTRAQWADQQLQDRQEVERVQTRRGARGE